MKYCLIVDDSRSIREMVKRTLQKRGVHCEEAANGQLALDACIKTMPDAILLDLNMPVMGGFEFLRHLRALPGGDNPIVVFCTVENDMEYIQMAIDAGANEYIQKPFDSKILQVKFAQAGFL